MSDDNSLVSSILGLGEERMGEVVNQLLANERFAGALQNAVIGGVNAKRSVDKSLSRIYGMANVPTLDDMEQVREKLLEVEELMGEVQSRVDLLARKRKRAANKQSETKGSKKKPAKKATKKAAKKA